MCNEHPPASVVGEEEAEQPTRNIMRNFKSVSLKVPNAEHNFLPQERVPSMVLIQDVSESLPETNQVIKNPNIFNCSDYQQDNSNCATYKSLHNYDEISLPQEVSSQISEEEPTDIFPYKKASGIAVAHYRNAAELLPVMRKVKSIPNPISHSVALHHLSNNQPNSNKHAYDEVLPKEMVSPQASVEEIPSTSDNNHMYYQLEIGDPYKEEILEETGLSSMASSLSDKQLLKKSSSTSIAKMNPLNSPCESDPICTQNKRRSMLTKIPSVSNIFDDPTYGKATINCGSTAVESNTGCVNIYANEDEEVHGEVPAIPDRSWSLIQNKSKRMKSHLKQENTKIKFCATPDKTNFHPCQLRQVSLCIFDEPKYDEQIIRSDNGQ